MPPVESKPVANPKTLDAMGGLARAERLHQVLFQIQNNLLGLELEQLGNGYADDHKPEGQEKTVGERRAELERIEARLLDRFPDLHDEIPRIVTIREAQQRAVEAERMLDWTRRGLANGERK